MGRTLISPYDPPMAGRLVSPTLVGRSAELAAHVAAMDRAIDGTAVHQLIGGEAGVGKSRLVRDVAALAAGKGIRVLVGGCADIGDGGVPYGPIVEILRTLARELGDAELGAIMGPARADLARLVPSLGPASEGASQTEFLQPRLLDAILGVVQRLAEVAPVLLVVEDLHWADPATRDSVAFLVRQLRLERVLVVMTFRSDELQRRHPLLPWLAEIGRSGRVERTDLARLDGSQTSELLAAILGVQPDPDLVEQIHGRSDGNPFFIEELLGAVEGRTVEGDASAGVAGQALGRLPPTLRDVLLARIVALPEQTQAVVRVAAVAGRRVGHDLLVEVSGMPESELTIALRTAVERHVLVTEMGTDGGAGDYAFRHALFQEAAYDDLLPGERGRLHRAFAEALAARGPGTGAVAAGHWAALAYHWAAAHHEERAFEASIRAGAAAAGTFAFADSQRHDERALEMWPTIPDAERIAGMDRLALLARAADAAFLTGDGHRAAAQRREVVDALRATSDPVRLGVALERLGRALWYNGQVPAAIAAHEEAIALLPADPPSAELARALAGYAQILMLIDRWADAEAVGRRAGAMAREVGARQAEGHAMNSLGLVLATTGRPAEGFESLRGALAIAHEVANVDDIGRAYVNLAAAAGQSGDPDGVLELVREGNEVLDRLGLTHTYGAFLRENGLAAAYELGRWPEAERLAGETADAPSPGRQGRYRMARWVGLLVAQGDDRAADVLRQLRDVIEGFPVEGQFNAPFRVATAEAVLWTGDPAAAIASINKGIAELEAPAGIWYVIRLYRVGLRAIAELAENARARRDAAAEAAAIEMGEALWKRLQPMLRDARARQHGRYLEGTEAEVATIEAERARLRREPAVEAWRAAAERWEARSNPYVEAYCRWRLADALLALGHRPAASEALAAAHGLAARLGARPLLGELEALAARARLTFEEAAVAPSAGDRSPSSPSDPFGLTRRERDVLPLLVQGRTNRQIAEALFISENTAGVHVSNILGKLGAVSRTEAAGIAARLGLGDA